MSRVEFTEAGFRYRSFDPADKEEFLEIGRLISRHLSEPYSLYVYWYFFQRWPEYCFLVSRPEERRILGVVISNVDTHREVRMRGYIGMLVIDPEVRGCGIAKRLVRLSVDKMKEWAHVDEIMLETEVVNSAALHLYELFGFLRMKRMHRYYLNGGDAFRLILPVLDRLATRVGFLPKLFAKDTPQNTHEPAMAFDLDRQIA